MSQRISAIAVFDSKIKGIVRFIETPDNHVEIEVHLTGLKKNHHHGFHVHECGDLSEQCESMCAHFIPLNMRNCGISHIQVLLTKCQTNALVGVPFVIFAGLTPIIQSMEDPIQKYDTWVI
jgi:hypothetical protein